MARRSRLRFSIPAPAPVQNDTLEIIEEAPVKKAVSKKSIISKSKKKKSSPKK